jgi:hypothetical protein
MYFGTLPVFLSLPPIHHEVNHFTLPPAPTTMMFCLVSHLKAIKPADLEMKPLKPQATIVFLCLSSFARYFVIVTKICLIHRKMYVHVHICIAKLTDTQLDIKNLYSHILITDSKFKIEKYTLVIIQTPILWELYYQETLKMSTQTKINIKRHE